MKPSFPIENFILRAAIDKRILPSHMSLFMVIFFYSPEQPTGRLFGVSRQKLMRFAKLKSISTYHKCLSELVELGYITYQPSFDPYRASRVSINDNS